MPGVDEFSAVHVVGDDGVFDVGHVDADLVGPAGLWEEHNERVATEAFEDFVECDRLFAAIGTDCIPFSMFGVLAEGGVNAVACQVGRAVGDGHVGLGDLSVLELFGDFPLGAVVPGYDYHASSVSVESMDDAGAELTVDV